MRYLLSVLAVLFWFNSVNAETTTCTTNDLGDRTCTTTTPGTNIPGTTTGNILENSTFGTGSTTSTTGWSTDGDHGVHTHGNFGNFPYQSGMDTSGGVLAFQGHEEDNVYQDVDLVGDGHLTQSQINEGFTSTMSADVWFWNSVQNTLTLKQTITTPDGTVTTQTRVLNDTNAGRPTNGGTFTNYTNVYTHNSNTETDFTIRAELYNVTAGTAYDSMHMGPDVDNVELSITTAGSVTQGTSSTVFTPCSELGTCTYDNEAVEDAVNLTGDDGKELTASLDDKFKELDKEEEFKVEEFKVETFVMVPTVEEEVFEEVKFETFVGMKFEEFISQNNLVETFETALVEEGITKEEFYDELSDTLKEEAFDDITPQSQSEEIKEEKSEITQEGELNATSTDIRTTDKPETTESKEVVQSNETEDETGPQNETVSNERELDDDTKTERQAQAENTGEVVETGEIGTSTTGEFRVAEVDGIAEKVARVIKKLETKLKRVDDRLKATSYVLAVGLQSTQPEITSYTNKRIYGGNKLGYALNNEFFDNINRIEQQQIYKEVTLTAYTSNDPIAVRARLLSEIDIKKQKLKADIAALRSN